VIRGHSLRARLLGFLLMAVIGTVALQATIAYRTALAEADAIFDYQMQQTALSLRAAMPLALLQLQSPGAEAPDDENFNFIVQVWSANGLALFRAGSRTVLPRPVELGFSSGLAKGVRYRIYALQTRDSVIQVAQDMATRRDMASALALRTVWPVALMAPLLMLLVGWVVTASLAPVARVRSQVAQRQADDLEPVSQDGLPHEIVPLVDELNLLFDRLRAAFDAQKNFVADAAHELRSPLAALKLQVQALERAGDEAGRALGLSRLAAGIDRASRVVEQLLVLARQQAQAAAGKRPEPVSLADIAREAVGEIAAEARLRGIDVGLVRADAGEINGHLDALRILLRNLLDNAVKYCLVGGSVDVAVVRDKNWLMLRVEDSGPGIAPAERERALDRFYRSPDNATSGATGSGLGLAIVKSIAELHGATVSLEDSPALKGLLVTVRFGVLGIATVAPATSGEK
jgi:two-component system, OmpR family, sensor kinase